MLGFLVFVFSGRGVETHLSRGLPKGGFSQVASLGGMSPHSESECSSQTKLSRGSSPAAVATCAGLRGKRGHGVYHTSADWGGQRGEEETIAAGGGVGGEGADHWLTRMSKTVLTSTRKKRGHISR